MAGGDINYDIYTVPPETNIAPENRPLEKEIPIGNHHFHGVMLVSGRVHIQSRPNWSWKHGRQCLDFQFHVGPEIPHGNDDTTIVLSDTIQELLVPVILALGTLKVHRVLLDC